MYYGKQGMCGHFLKQISHLSILIFTFKRFTIHYMTQFRYMGFIILICNVLGCWDKLRSKESIHFK